MGLVLAIYGPSAHVAPRSLHARARLMPRCSTPQRVPSCIMSFPRHSTQIRQGCCGCQGRMVDVRITVRCALTRASRAFRRIESERVQGSRKPYRTSRGGVPRPSSQHGPQTRRRINVHTAGDDNDGVRARRPRFDGQLIRASRRRQCCRPAIQGTHAKFPRR